MQTDIRTAFNPTAATSSNAPTVHNEFFVPRKRKTKKKTQSTLGNFVTRPITISKQKAITDAISFMIAVDFQPFSIVEDTGFQHVMHTADPAYKIPSRSHFSKTLIPMNYTAMREKVEILLKSAQAISLTTDTWTSNRTQSYMAVTAHFISPSWKQVSVLLGCIHFVNSHTAENLRNSILSLAKDWNIEKKN